MSRWGQNLFCQFSGLYQKNIFGKSTIRRFAINHFKGRSRPVCRLKGISFCIAVDKKCFFSSGHWEKLALHCVDNSISSYFNTSMLRLLGTRTFIVSFTLQTKILFILSFLTDFQSSWELQRPPPPACKSNCLLLFWALKKTQHFKV